jgi:hypothetical protein
MWFPTKKITSLANENYFEKNCTNPYKTKIVVIFPNAY